MKILKLENWNVTKNIMNIFWCF